MLAKAKPKEATGDSVPASLAEISCESLTDYLSWTPIRAVEGMLAVHERYFCVVAAAARLRTGGLC